MPLSLTDCRWNDLRSSYKNTRNVVAWLTEAYQEKGLSSERLGDLINEVQHQGGTSTAMYAVATHLIMLARQAPPENALELLTHAGLIYADSGSSSAVPCPSFLQNEFSALASEGANLLSPLLPLAEGFDEFKWAVEGLAGFMGLHNFAEFLFGLEFFQGRFYHSLIDGPFPTD
jgi:hypothetical protein